MNTIIEKIRAEIERLKQEIYPVKVGEQRVNRGPTSMESAALGALNAIMSRISTLQEQPVCEGLEDVADTLAEEHGFVKKPDFKPAKYSWSAVRDVFIEGVIAGAQWQKEQMMKGAIDVTLNYTHQITLEGGEGFGKKGEHIKFIIVKGD